MDKFAKHRAPTPLLPRAVIAIPQPTGSDDPLVFDVPTREGLIHTVDLTRYRDGDAAHGIGGSPSLIADLLPTIRATLSHRSRKAITSWIHRRLPILFKFVTHLQQEVGFAPEKAADFDNEDGALLKEFILLSDLGPVDRRKYFTGVRTLLAEVRGDGAPVLHWPDIEVGRDLRIHADVNPDAVREIYHACKRVLDNASLAEKRGQAWLATGVRPDHLDIRDPRQPGQRGSIKNKAWYEHANLAVLTRDCMRQRITGQTIVPAKTEAKLRMHFSYFGMSFAGVTFPEIWTSLAPSIREVIASVLIVSMETGWIDTVSGIDLSDSWYSLRRPTGENDEKTASVILYACRPKTSRRLTAIGQAGTRFRAFQVIQSIERRSQFLRRCLIERRDVLQSQILSKANVKEIAEIELRLRSPWLYFNAKGRGAKAVGIFGSPSMGKELLALKDLAIAALPPAKRANKAFLKAILEVSWSDMRDAFAAHIFAKSGGNVFLVKRALGHNDVSVTRHYLRQKRMIRERFDAFRKMVQFTLDEIEKGGSVDPTLIFLSNYVPDFGTKHRVRLSAFRTRMDMGCNDPTRPSPFLAPGHSQGSLCAVQRCILCRQGVIFRSAWRGLAQRHGELVWLRGRSNAMRWLTSTFSWELDAIELIRDTIFKADRDDFIRRSENHVAALTAGSVYLFDDPELTGSLH